MEIIVAGSGVYKSFFVLFFANQGHPQGNEYFSFGRPLQSGITTLPSLRYFKVMYLFKQIVKIQARSVC